jgi:hypothetical protein
LEDNLQSFLNIYGQNQYVGQDSAIYQLLSIISLKQSDTNLGLQLAYNQSSPATAVGAGLDRDVKMNGLARDPYSYSTAVLTLTGTANIVIVNGAAQDQNGNIWSLPTSVTLVGGSVAVTAICTTPGNISAEPGTINIINTPVNGWATVTNVAEADPGNPIETDSQLRARQAVSVALPGLTPISATIAAVLATPDVTRVAPGYPTSDGPGSSIENPTSAVDSWGNPAHSISIVAEGGLDAAVALSIYLKKTIGCYTNGTTSVAVADPNTGWLETISFYRPTFLPIFVLMTIGGYGTAPTSAALGSVQVALVAYLNELQIGETASLAALVYEAMAVNASLIVPAFGVQSTLIGTTTASTTATTVASNDVIAVASATGIAAGQLVVGAGVPAGTTVLSIASLNITLSAECAASASGVAVVFSTLAAADIVMPTYYTAAEGLVANIAVVAA